jgi:hypothetical protein
LTNILPNSGMNMLIATTDAALFLAFEAEANAVSVQAHSTSNHHEFEERFDTAKYEAVVLDFDTLPNADDILSFMRESRCNKNAVVFAVASNRKNIELALQRRAHFILNRPLEASAIGRTLRVAYDLMLQDRRRQFRCAATLPVQLTLVQSRSVVQCSTTNVSSNGIAINAPVPLKLAEPLQIEFVLPDGYQIRASGFVVWDDKHGKAGINFQCSAPEMRQKLNSWLESQFESSVGILPVAAPGSELPATP